MKPVIKKTCPEPVEWKRNQKNRTAPPIQAGFSLVELLVVIGIIALLVGLSMPAINAMQKSFDSTGSEGMISAALATARTLAISNKPATYAGVRFQKAYNKNGPQIDADQYMIFVVNDEPKNMGNLDEGFRAIEGYKPIKLPKNIGLIDKKVRTNNGTSDVAARTGSANERDIITNDLDDLIVERTMTDTSAFSIVFSPAGKLVIHDIRVRNKKGDYRSPDPNASGNDNVFNSYKNIKDNNTGQFVQDDYADLGLGGEQSRSKFYIYDRGIFEKMTDKTQRMNYLNELKFIYVNPYTGALIEK